jgi:hypothetical protein
MLIKSYDTEDKVVDLILPIEIGGEVKEECDGDI